MHSSSLLSIAMLICALPSASTAAEVVVELVSDTALGGVHAFPSQFPAISGDGRYIAFESAGLNYIPGDVTAGDIFVLDRNDDSIEHISKDSQGVIADGGCTLPTISADGRYVAFLSDATNLDASPDTNGEPDVYVHDRQTSVTWRVSVDSGGTGANGECFDPSISADGRFVIFTSRADNLVAGDDNGSDDIFVHELASGTTTLESSEGPGPGECLGTGPSRTPTISGDGALVAFVSSNCDLDAGVPGCWDGPCQSDSMQSYERVRATAVTNMITGGSLPDRGTAEPSLSADGTTLAFSSVATNVGGDPPTPDISQVYVRGVGGLSNEIVSRSTAGAIGNGHSLSPSLSADGRFVVFASEATNLVPDDTNGVIDIFLRDRQAGTTTRVSVGPGGAEADKPSSEPRVSDDGSLVTFFSRASNLVVGDTNNFNDAFVADLGPTPAPTLTVTPASAFMQLGETLTLLYTGSGAIIPQWELDGEGTLVPGAQATATYTPSVPGSVTITISDTSGADRQLPPAVAAVHVDAASYIAVNRMKLSLNTKLPEKSRLKVNAVLDMGALQPGGGAASLLDGPATLTVGAFVAELPAPTLKGKAFVYKNEDATLKVIPTSDSSAAKFILKAKADFTGLIDPDAAVTLAFVRDTLAPVGSVTLAGGAFVLKQDPNGMTGPALFVKGAVAGFKGPGKDTWKLKLGLPAAGAAPAETPKITLTLSSGLVQEVFPANLKRKGDKFLSTGPLGVLSKLVVDYKKGEVLAIGKNLDLGPLPGAPRTETITVLIDDVSRSVSVVLAPKGKSLKY